MSINYDVLYIVHPPPDNINLAEVQPGKLIFNWTSTISTCSTVQYNIASDGGSCPVVTNMTTVTCSDLQLTANANVCHFRVSNRACGLVGTSSSPVAVTLKGSFIKYHAATTFFSVRTTLYLF